MAGRRTKLTPQVQQRLVRAIGKGATYKLAALYAGIGETTFKDWRKRGEEEESGIYVDFVAAIEAAEGRAAYRSLSLISKAAIDTWQAGAWLLERRYPHEYGRTVQSRELSGPDGGPIVVKGYVHFSPEDWDESESGS
jgi:hypothetical protein